MNRQGHLVACFSLIALLASVEFMPYLVKPGNALPTPPPRKSPGLKALVDGLQAQTPTANRTDLDGDGLNDPVEDVIGTDFNNTDSDFDRLSDYYEVQNDLDPMNPDSNDDGLPDYYEVTDVPSSDIDGDGLANAWDFDNDGDGVNDDIDLSPFATTNVQEGFHFDISTNGNPVYLTFQLKPTDPNHLKLFDQFWDWPYDKEGSMKDQDNSKEDVFVLPYLNLTINVPPDQLDVALYGIYVAANYTLVPLLPVLDYGTIVAFSGKIPYPSSAPLSLSMDARLIWKVIGINDEKANALQATNGKYVSLTSNGAVVANASEITLSETFKWFEIGETSVAMRALNGMFLSAAPDGSIVANGSEIGDREIYEWVNKTGNPIGLKAHNGKYIAPSADGRLVANSNVTVAFSLIDMGYLPEKISLVNYGEDFMITGLSVEESYGCDVGLFYSDDVNQTVAANFLLAYKFLRNATATVSEMPGILVGYNVDVAHQLDSFSNIDATLHAIANVMTPVALDSLPANQTLPIIIAYEESSVSLDLSELVPSHPLLSSYTGDLISKQAMTTKTLKTDWYNTSSYDVLTIEDIMYRINGYGLDENATFALMTMMLYWYTGEQRLVGALEATELEDIEWVVNAIGDIVEEGLCGLTGLYRGTLGLAGLRGYRQVKALMSMGWDLKTISRILPSWVGKKWAITPFKKYVATCSKIQKTNVLFKNWNRVIKLLDFAALLADVGISIWSAVAIYESTDLDAYSMNTALLKTTMRLVFTLMLFAIGEIPFVGWLIAATIALSDALGGWSDKFFDWLIGKMSRISGQVKPDLEVMGEVKVTTYDWDDNGIDVGDRILLKSLVKGIASGSDWDIVKRSEVYPYYRIYAPAGSYSTTGFLYPPTYAIPPYGQYGMWDDFWEYPRTAHFPLPSSSKMTWTRNNSACWQSYEYEDGAWIEPGIGMPNFPVYVNLDVYSELWWKWEHYVFLGFYGFWCEHIEDSIGVNNVGGFTMYFDVLPGNISDFAGWRGITLLDHDGDGLRDVDETGSDPWRFDTDADGLCDKYEVEFGTDAIRYDTDVDGLLDYFELVYGTDATNGDTDGDGLMDYLEIAGWVISFKYFGQNFTTRVCSDPNIFDSDGDGVNDCMEYWSDLNPRSKDTNGDGLIDVEYPIFDVTNIEFIKSWDVPFGDNSHADTIGGIAVDDKGFVYVIKDLSWESVQSVNDNAVMKFDSEGNLITSWMKHYDVRGIALDNKNGYVYVSTEIEIYRFSENGTWLGTWNMIDPINQPGRRIKAISTDSNGFVYYAETYEDIFNSTNNWAHVNKCDVNGTLIDTWGSYGTGPDQLSLYIYGLAVDDKNQLIYVALAGRVAMFDIDGNYLTDLPHGFRIWDARGVTIDTNGNVYFVDPYFFPLKWGGSGKAVHKFNPDGIYIVSWGNSGTEEGNFTYPIGIAVDKGNDVYVADREKWLNYYNTGRVHKFSQYRERPTEDPIIDRDGDGLSGGVETSGMDITFTNATSSYTIHVTSEPLLNDTDFDRLSDFQEYNIMTNPRDPDTDDDGLSDFQEWRGFSPKTDPKHFDTDGDGLPDGVEITYGSDPTKEDTDDEGLSDLQEFGLGSDPNSTDTDRDGLNDFNERAFNSSLLNPDSDGDFMFDNMEFELGTNPQGNDSDDDGLRDGIESIFNTNPLSNDTDGDNLTDTFEIDNRLNPTSNDTDNDGLLDGIELEKDTNPWSNDTDFDGVPDGEDQDTNMSRFTSLVLAFDPDGETDAFRDNLSRFADVTVVSVQELLADHRDAPRIVLVGRPDGGGSVGNLTRELLADCGDVLDKMVESDNNRFAIRYGLWNGTQTVVMLSYPYPLDFAWVLDLLTRKTVTIMPDSAIVQFNTSLVVKYPPGGSLNHTALSSNFFKVDEMDTVKATDSIVYASLEEVVNPTVEIDRHNASTTPFTLSHGSGLSQYELAVGMYLNVTVSENVQNETTDLVESAWIQIYYSESDLDRTGDGHAGDSQDLDETTLALYYFNTSSASWIKLSSSLDWVIGTGVNTTDVELYGEHYAGYVWAIVRHFSPYGLAALTPNVPPTADANGPYTANEGASVAFDGTASKDPDGTIISYEWDLDGDGLYDDASGATPSYAWGDDYAGAIGLKVTDDEGTTAMGATTVTVLNVAPTAEAGADLTVHAGDTAHFGGSFIDPGWLDTHIIAWQFGDGQSAMGTLTPDHAYITAGTYTVTLTVIDDDGGEGSDTLTVDVLEILPPMTTITISGPKYGDFVSSSSLFTLQAEDPGGSGIDETHYSIDMPTGPWIEYVSPFTIPKACLDCSHVIYFYSTDRVGNVEGVRELAIILDNTAPLTTLSIGNPKCDDPVTHKIFITSSTKITLEASDGEGSGISTIEYRLDGGSWKPYNGPFTLHLSDSIHKIEYRGRDRVGNIEAIKSIHVILFTWDYVFEDSHGRGTTFKINTLLKLFQFTAPGKDFGIRRATTFYQFRKTIIIHHQDSQLRLITLVLDTKLDHCVAIAFDLQTHEQYILIDKVGPK